MNLIDRILYRAGVDNDFRTRLLDNPTATLSKEYDLHIAEDYAIVVHEETDKLTHLVLPPKDKFSFAERNEAKVGGASLEFLKKTMYDPAPPMRTTTQNIKQIDLSSVTTDSLASIGRESIARSLQFLQTTIHENGAWHCIRFNVRDSEIPRHFERPPFVSAFCVLALRRSKEPLAQVLCTRTQNHLVKSMEFPGFWRYYRHLPQDLDSSSLCSLVIDTHPWIRLGRNVPRILANRDDNGLFMTWLLHEDEPSVVSPFRIEADPVVNANVVSYLGDISATKNAQEWLVELIMKESHLEGSSKWYPDVASIYYAIARSMVQVPFGPDQLSETLADRIMSMQDDDGEFNNVLQAAQAVTALHSIGHLDRIDVKKQTAYFVNSQREDGSWPELLAFGDQSLRWGVVGQIGHGSESVTSVFCVEALECLLEVLKSI